MRSIEDVRSRIFEMIRPTAAEKVPLDEAVGRFVAEAIIAPHDVPSFANSAMDGYAVRASDVSDPGTTLTVLEDVAAGATATLDVRDGEATKIMTGAPMPAGADTVVRVEDTREADGKVTVMTAPTRGTAVRPPGGDITGGTTVFSKGARLTSVHIGVLATIGVVEVPVARRPRVAVMSTGDELVPAETDTLAPGMIRDSNRPMIVAMVGEAGGDVVDLGRIPDDADALRSALGEAAATCDVIVSSGGVSMGEFDVTKMVLQESADVEFFPVAMKPGKPQGLGLLGGKPFFGLPGNPVSVLVSFEQFVRPALLAMQGATALLRPRVIGTAAEDFESDPAKEEFIRARIVGNQPSLSVVHSGGQGSHVLSGAANADLFAVLGRDVARVAAGEPVTLEMFRSMETRTVGDE